MVTYIATYVLVCKNLGGLYGSKMPTLPHQLVLRHKFVCFLSTKERINQKKRKLRGAFIANFLENLLIKSKQTSFSEGDVLDNITGEIERHLQSFRDSRFGNICYNRNWPNTAILWQAALRPHHTPGPGNNPFCHT